MTKTCLRLVAVVVVSSASAMADCSYQAGSAPSGLSDVGPYTDPKNIYLGTDTLAVSVAFTCSNSGTSCDMPKWSGTIKLVYAEAPDFEAQWNRYDMTGGCMFPPFFSNAGWPAPGGTVPCTFPGVAGVNVKVASRGSCSGQGYMIDDWRYSSNVVVPPALEDLSLNMKGNYPGARATLSSVPVGVPFRVYGINAIPAGSDVVTIRVEGAGISFTRTYGAKTDSTGKPQSISLDWGNDPDDSASIVAKQVGDFQLWAELNGVKSKVVTLHADTRSESSGSSSGGGSGGGTGNTPSGGCSSVGVGGLALAALLLRRRSTASR